MMMALAQSGGTGKSAEIFRGVAGVLRARYVRQEEIDFETFAERRLHIMRIGDGEVVPFRLNGIQRAYLDAKRKAVERGMPKKFLVLKYRQGGITTIEQALSYRLAVTKQNVRCLTLSYDADHTATIFDMALLMHEKDPKQIPLKTNNMRILHYPSVNSVYKALTAGSKKSGRGRTLHRVHCSEVAWYFEGRNRVTHQRKLLSGLTRAAKHGEIVLETTPNGDELFHQYWEESKERGPNAAWTNIFLPWFMDPENNSTAFNSSEAREQLIDTLTDEERELVARCNCTLEMINFRRSAQNDLGILFPQEYPEDDASCFLMSGTCWFDVELIRRIMTTTPDYELEHVPGGHFVYWEEPIPMHNYVLGADTSEGIAGRDPSGAGVFHVLSGRQVAAFHGHFRPPEFAEHLVKLAHKYNNALAGIERNNHGHAVIQKVNDLGYGCLFKAEDDRAGWVTNQKTRPIMLNDFNAGLTDGSIGVRDRAMLKECAAFRLQSDGQFSADSGQHDDRVIKWAIAWQMRKHRSAYAGSERTQTVDLHRSEGFSYRDL